MQSEIVYDSSKSGEKSMNAADKRKTTAWASGRTWCAAQVVIIDGITAWKIDHLQGTMLHLHW